MLTTIPFRRAQETGCKPGKRSAAFVKLIGIVLRGAQRVKCRKAIYPALPVLPLSARPSQV